MFGDLPAFESALILIGCLLVFCFCFPHTCLSVEVSASPLSEHGGMDQQ